MLRVARFALVCAAASCGGNVVVDGVGGGGAAVSCETVCPKIAALCPTKTGDCASHCASLDALQVSGACPAEVDAYLVCLDQTPSFLCSTSSSACTTEANAFSSCSTAYCSANPASCPP